VQGVAPPFRGITVGDADTRWKRGEAQGVRTPRPDDPGARPTTPRRPTGWGMGPGVSRALGVGRAKFPPNRAHRQRSFDARRNPGISPGPPAAKHGVRGEAHLEADFARGEQGGQSRAAVLVVVRCVRPQGDAPHVSGTPRAWDPLAIETTDSVSFYGSRGDNVPGGSEPSDSALRGEPGSWGTRFLELTARGNRRF
jgi:hypothetical protein